MIQPIYYGRQQTLLSQRRPFDQPIRWRVCQGGPTDIMYGFAGSGTSIRQMCPSQMVTEHDQLSTPCDTRFISKFYGSTKCAYPKLHAMWTMLATLADPVKLNHERLSPWSTILSYF
jgi:hypothetical protein